MNKTAIKNFTVWARNKLIADITYKAGLIGVSENGIAAPLPQSSKDLQFFDIGTKDYVQVAGAGIKQRNALVNVIQEKECASDYKTAFKSIIEEVAYTWFNRLIAIRFMEVNEYLPSRIRVLSSENPAKNEPDFVTTPFDTDLEFTVAEQDKIMKLKDENKLDELFRMLFIKQCNKLHEILPELFERTNDYTELLLSISFTDSDGIVYHLVHDIDEDDFNVEKEGQVEIIGWMYQYYNIEPKDETFALLKKNVKITKERIPAATQLFTPDWIVRYMVENSLGRLWVEGHPNDNLKENWKYYLEEAEQELDVETQLEEIRAEYRNLNPEDIKVIDPCMGSGHILVYCFDVLMQIYESQGYTQRDAAQSILENNLYGLDIDKRAAQLAYFAVMMKACEYDRRFLKRGIQPHVCAISESNGVDSYTLEYFCNGDAKLTKAMKTIVDELHDAEEYGSLLTVTPQEWSALYARFDEIEDDISMHKEASLALKPLVETAQVLSQKYHTVCTNPPYMGSSNMNGDLAKYVKDNYPDSKSDLFAVFIERCGKMVVRNGYQAMITQHAWMFLSSFEKLRGKMQQVDTVNMAHLGPRAFEEIGGEVVQTTSFVLRKSHTPDYKGTYCRLIEPTTQQGKEDMFFLGENRYVATQDNFAQIPGSPVAYWVSQCVLNIFSNTSSFRKYGKSLQGTVTGDNERFMRLWYEIAYYKLSIATKSELPSKWYPYCKGGEFRRWYGNLIHVINWENDGFEIRNFYDENGRLKSRPQNTSSFFKEGITWSSLTGGFFGGRYLPDNSTFSDIGPLLILNNNECLYNVLAYVNSKVFQAILDICCTGLHYQNGIIAGLPCIDPKYKSEYVDTVTKECISISQKDWDSYETSWDFQRHPLVGRGVTQISDAFVQWESECETRFQKLKSNEEELNRIFIEIYGLQDELTSEVKDKDVTVRKADLGRDIRSLLSYAVGCMLGRYSLDEPGLAYAGGEWDDKKYKTFIPDRDNCIPITDEEYFEDDIVGLFVTWLKKVYGADTLEENLDFIAKALGNKGATSREIIRNYFLNDFMKDHIKIYQKRPIYWLFDSGKQNGFKALVYMHRWNADTVGNLRVEYLHKMQHIYEREITRMQETIDNNRDSREVSRATKRKDKLQKQLKETKEYDAKLAHIALSRIEIDLDDGVKVNYEKVQTGRDGKKMQILAKI
ncbi:MAG: BREX-1 system adenine-specific DNA-methyltransferase PglX [Eubacteriales bacterium]|nr:BREX-1 system adenine-specific DNA-methyltransferase PglX [Eubacteriales bacterium]